MEGWQNEATWLWWEVLLIKSKGCFWNICIWILAGSPSFRRNSERLKILTQFQTFPYQLATSIVSEHAALGLFQAEIRVTFRPEEESPEDLPISRRRLRFEEFVSFSLAYFHVWCRSFVPIFLKVQAKLTNFRIRTSSFLWKSSIALSKSTKTPKLSTFRLFTECSNRKSKAAESITS